MSSKSPAEFLFVICSLSWPISERVIYSFNPYKMKEALIRLDLRQQVINAAGNWFMPLRWLGTAVHSWHNSCVKAGENKQGDTCQTDKWLCCFELSAEAICFLDKEDCSPKSGKDKPEERDECGAGRPSTWGDMNRKDFPSGRVSPPGCPLSSAFIQTRWGQWYAMVL